jgi:predicted lipid-binding transport protein (Tim44 family)
MQESGWSRLTAARKPRAGAAVACQGPRAHTRGMGRIIGTILGAILAIWLAVTAAGGIAATLKTFVIIGLIAMAVVIVVWLVARRPGRG